MRIRCAIAALTAAIGAIGPCSLAGAQTGEPGPRLMNDAAVRAALDHARANEPAAIDEQVRLCEIPAPPFMETARAQAYADAFRGVGLRNVRIANPVHALGRAIAGLADIRPPAVPRTTFNVGRIGGGTSVNAISVDAWMEVDMRSANQDALRDLDGQFHAAVDAALAAENTRWDQKGRLTVTKMLVGDRPAGAVDASSDIVQRTVSVTRALGLPVELTEGSTDANAPMSLNIPAITIDAGGSGTGAHTLDETFDTTDSWRGTQRTLLTAIALIALSE